MEFTKNQKIGLAIFLTVLFLIIFYFIFKKTETTILNERTPRKLIGYYETWRPSTSNGYLGPECDWTDCIIKKDVTEQKCYETRIEPYTMINFSFLTLVKQPDLMGTTPQTWDGNIYYNTYDATSEDVMNVLKRLYDITIKKGKKFTIAFGGWSDVVKFTNKEEAEKAGKMMVTIAQKVGSDCGIDINYYHLTSNPWKSSPPQTELIAHMMNAIRKADQTRYLSYTTKFNGFYNADSKPYGTPVGTFDSDNEAQIVWNTLDNVDVVDNVNIMAYDSAAMVDGKLKTTLFDYDAIIDNFITGGVPKEKIIMGIKPGKQNRDATWLGFNTHVQCVAVTKHRDIGGMLVSKINPTPDGCKQGSKDSTCSDNPEIAKKQYECASIVTPIVAEYVRDCLLLDKNCTTSTPMCSGSCGVYPNTTCPPHLKCPKVISKTN